ncbi:glutathione-dependent formaldehyde dehydrogenase [Streptomyces cellulosae]|jgi:threonine dehydrogenase-like Zn-dependent dehydrogenase|uniref:Threonine dehydrogenase-like Zn-dependent dehydrogenase n=1 Tax=Streptomyces thermodiastaticus TaxID=44061 RepID=A0ABU0KT86_9ACTN|nr:glutathione-dependent formaldehyde dehydrogenase [Streptomyces sp. McG7]MBT2904784.1 glutathione-dependent formaldehyde dehydrogenase [Streptomyces sp. McG8]MCX4481296.1 glutathione-dependent formaldehyde dehydrogenase [Streptomyces cellulosae]MDQ0491606.1 threonine dehydrogenase-like Zn-dependent dehydrogenase [Streptomyces thermodiastaticus]MDX3417925.1 glutathione-dependent formaldehyde dehydrogenase [Streptomyces sp. MD20-1-1]MXQ59547.1 alcohol dehydrogenase catalytic domain-containing 
MKALTWQGKRDVRVETVPDPKIEEPTDAIIRITSSGLCGSDLHLYEVLTPFMTPGDILGHEPMGIVEEVGAGVPDLQAGDRVVVPFQIACGNCWMCLTGLPTQCETTQVTAEGMGAPLFGYTRLYGAVPGAQAEYLRVPQAQFGPIKVPEGPADDRFVYLSDVLPTAWQAVAYAEVPKGGSVAVLGLGPIGDMACRIAQVRGAGRVFGVDLVPERLRRAKARGVETFDLRSFDDEKELVEAIRDQTDGRGPDAVIDAVGTEAHGSAAARMVQNASALLPRKISGPMAERFSVDRLAALYTAIELVRRGGTISLSGVYGGMADPMPMLTLFDKQVQMRMGQANVRRWSDEIIPYLTDEDPLGVDDFATHRVSLDEAPEAYDMFQKKRDGAVKVLFQP